jgi:hypothetical protein
MYTIYRLFLTASIANCEAETYVQVNHENY